MPVHLRKRKNADGTTSLRLDIWHEGRRWFDPLHHLKLQRERNLIDREHNKSLMSQAQAERMERAVSLQAAASGVVAETDKRTPVVEWMQAYVDRYKLADKRNMQGALDKFKAFLDGKRLVFAGLTPLLIEDFIAYLEHTGTHSGPASYFARFKKLVRRAWREGKMRSNPLDRVERKIKGVSREKDVLTLPELRRLADTPIQSEEVRRAFLFSACTGLRFCDVKTLTWSEIDGRSIRKPQAKTKTLAVVPLNDMALSLIGEPAQGLIFALPSHDGANKTLRAWVRRAGIDKHITWHNARHSFGTNLIIGGIDLVTTSKLLGHTTMKHTQRYIKIAEEMLRAGTDKINF
jgi:site-specific recombinase XerD